MATSKPKRKIMSMEEEDKAFFESAYKNNPKAREDMDKRRAQSAKTPAKKTTGKGKK